MDDVISGKALGLSRSEISGELARLDRGIPWTHHFDLGGVETISAERDEKFYRKAIGSKRIIDLALTYCRNFSNSRDVRGLRVLDIASAEGAYSIAFAQAGAQEVIGIEGRELYVGRARFIARALDVGNVRFVQGDVRKIPVDEFGQADFTICAGILHHLGIGDFLPFLKTIGEVTRDTLFLYTHVSTEAAVKDFRLVGPQDAGDGLTGYLLREHADGATPQEIEQQVRASLDNTFSFWATEETLVRALKLSGFSTIVKVFEPHAFGGYANRNLRVIFIAKKQ